MGKVEPLNYLAGSQIFIFSTELQRYFRFRTTISSPSFLQLVPIGSTGVVLPSERTHVSAPETVAHFSFTSKRRAVDPFFRQVRPGAFSASGYPSTLLLLMGVSVFLFVLLDVLAFLILNQPPQQLDSASPVRKRQ